MDLKERTRWAINFIAKKEKLSNSKIGKIIGIKADTVNSYRAKLANPKVDFIIKFCDTFGIDLLWFTKGDGEPFPGAQEKFPEVCTPSRYETRPHLPEPPPSDAAGASFPASSATTPDDAEKYIVINATEKSLVALCKLIGIPIERGWKSALSEYLGITAAQLSNSISRDKLSKNLLINIEERGFAADNWLIRTEKGVGTVEQGDAGVFAAEISFQKLSLLCGIKIDGNWISALSTLLGTEPWHISMAIRNDRIEPALFHRIEEKGYPRSRWAVARPAGAPGPGHAGRPLTDEALLKMAESVLKSGTAHAAALAMSIVSMDAAVKGKEGIGDG